MIINKLHNDKMITWVSISQPPLDNNLNNKVNKHL